MTLQDITHLISFTTAVLFIFFAVLQLSLKKKLPLNYYLAGVYFSGGYYFFYYWAFSAGVLGQLYPLINTDIAFSYAIGPFLYLYFATVSGVKVRTTAQQLIHFIPFAVSLIGLVLVNCMTPLPLSRYLVSDMIFSDVSYHPHLSMLELGSNISLAVYFVLTLFRVSIFFRSRKMGKEVIIVLAFLLMLVISVILLLIGRYSRYRLFWTIALGGFFLLPLYYMFFSFRFPEFSMKVLKEARTLRYEKSIVKNLNVDVLLERLNELMTEERVYSEESLSLDTLSSRLKVTPHQLSQILNDRLDRNFRSYVNRFRIDEAKNLLAQGAEATILDIAFTVGFSSKSSFYASFIKETGQSPTEFRKSKAAVSQLHS